MKADKKEGKLRERAGQESRERYFPCTTVGHTTGKNEQYKNQ